MWIRYGVFDTLDTTRTMTLWDPQQGWSYLMNDSGYNAVPVMGLIMYLLSLHPQNGWLTFIAAAVDVGAGFVILWGTAKRHGRVSLIVGVLAFLALFNFNAAVSGVRNYMAGALAIVICYLTSQKKLWYAALFFPLILIHPFVLIIAVIYFLSTTIKRHRFIFSIACAVLFLQRMLQDAIFALFERMSFIPFFASLSFKSKQYFGEESYLVLSSVFSYLRSILLFSLFSFIIVVDMRKRALTRYDGICIMLLCLDAGAILDQELFSRVTGVLLFAALPMLYRLLSSGVQQLRHGRIDACFSVVVIGVIIVFVDNLRAGVSFQNIEANLRWCRFLGLLSGKGVRWW